MQNNTLNMPNSLNLPMSNGELRERQMTARRGGEATGAVEDGRARSLRERVMMARAKSAKEGLKNAVSNKVMSPSVSGTSRLLRMAWYNLIPSLGFSLLWIDIHIFCSLVFGKKAFCELGEEWSVKVNPYAEKAAVVALNLMALFAIMFILTFMSMIVNFMLHPIDSTIQLMSLGWGGIKSLVSLFYDALHS